MTEKLLFFEIIPKATAILTSVTAAGGIGGIVLAISTTAAFSVLADCTSNSRTASARICRITIGITSTLRIYLYGRSNHIDGLKEDMCLCNRFFIYLSHLQFLIYLTTYFLPFTI